MPRRPYRPASILALLLLLAVAPRPWAASAPHLPRLKRLQQHLLLSEPAEKLEKLERAQERRKKRKKAKSGQERAGQRRRVDKLDDMARTPGYRARTARPSILSGLAAPPNRLVNDPNGEPAGSSQSEVSIASLGSNVVAAYNDGIGFYGPPFPDDTQGYSYSTDGGLTWTDGGPVPNAGLFVWASDPVVVVNEKTGAFYYCGLVDIPGSQNGIAVLKGTFSGSSFAWGTPRIVEQAPNSSALLDKQWMAADSLTGNLYLSYSHFVVAPGGFIISNSIRFERSTDDNQTWIDSQTLSTPGDAGMVQGSRPAVGPAGEVYVVWHAIGQASGPDANSPYGRDFLRIRKSVNDGASFAGQVSADSVFSNFGNGAPGFNRGIGITFPGIAVDRSLGLNRGRVYLTWNESLNFYNDQPPQPGLDPARSEIENNNTPSAPSVIQFVPTSGGEILRGTVLTTGNPGDLDYWKWNAVQGQTVIFYLDSLDVNLDAAFRIFCSDGTTLLAFSQNGNGGNGLLVFTVPTTGTYYMRVASYTGQRTGKYRVLAYVNAPQADRGRDHRDLFVKSSANGTTWGPTVRVNDSPPYFDDWLPEVQVDGYGRVFAAAYDWRDSPAICGGGSNVYLYRSDNAGASWICGVPMSEETTNWTAVYATLIPNQGDYIGLFAQDSMVSVTWSGMGENGDPDVFMTRTTLSGSSSQIAVVDVAATTDSVTVTWSGLPGVSGTLQRRQGETGGFVDLGTVTFDGAGRIVYVDTTVVAGLSYTYQIAVVGFCEQFAGTVTVNVPGIPGLPFGIALVRPNPTRQDVFVRPLITGSAPAYIELLDIAGRQIVRVDVPCPPQLFCEVNLTAGITVRPGLYFVRLVEGSQQSVKRVSIFP